MNNKFIRNFAIVAHIDHGKSTLADRLLEATGTIEPRLMKEQILDSNPIERERGITIKLAPVRMKFTLDSSTIGRVRLHTPEVSLSHSEYILNLIDTPGHVDFSYEVSRSLSACEGILLVVDATQGIQAQTLAHMRLIKDTKLKVIPIINKIDLPAAKIAEVKKSLQETFGFADSEFIEISAKFGVNIDKVLEAIILRIPAPVSDSATPASGLVFSSVYDLHKGVVIYVRVFDKEITKAPLKLYASNTIFNPIELGFFTPGMQPSKSIAAGEVGYIATGLKDLSLAKVGDTVGFASEKFVPLPGYREPKPMVFLSLYPVDNDNFLLLRQSLEKLHLSDSSFTYSLHSSAALGKGYLCGFLGLLHADIVRERLNREFGVEVIATAPSVEYKIKMTEGSSRTIHSPEDFPDPSLISEIAEPVMYTTVYTPKSTVGAMMQLCQEKRGELVNLQYLSNQAVFTYLLPLSEIILDFFDRLKSASSGFASLDYELFEYRKVDAVKLDIILNHDKVDAFSQIVVRENARVIAEKLVTALKDLIPRHQFEIPVQAAISGQIIARADIKAFRKDVTQKLYGGDRTRKDKLLEAQKKGKKRLRQFGKVEIP
ncbi:elongation factor 4, partial [Candidatus Gottesmanbacteria bacterium]|nr:elongation factor 4 [Candidatus Gottesmanbacteria bacterium]